MRIRKAVLQVIIASFLTCFVYLFYSGEFIRESVEDYSFDTINKYLFKGKKERVNAPNLLLFKFDDLTLNQLGLMDENGETNYGYLFPRNYIADFIVRLDAMVEQMETSNQPHSMFIDYDMSYTSDVHNKILTQDDLYLLKVLKKERNYKIYFPKTSNYNMIEGSSDPIIQEKIKEGKINFSSVGLTMAKDDISRRYYPYEQYLDKEGNEKVYPLVDIAIFNDISNKTKRVEDEYSQGRISVIEHRIIFKGYAFQEEYEGSEFIQSNWDNLKIFSANFDFESIIEEDFSNAIIFLGGSHSQNSDVFVMDSVDNELSGIEMHANALMTLFYFDGKLQRLPLMYAIIIICAVMFVSELFVQWIVPKIKNLFKKDGLKIFDGFLEDGFTIITIIILFGISYYLLTEKHLWFNWLIPSLMAGSILLFSGAYKHLRKFRPIKILRLIVWLKLIKFLKRQIKRLVGVRSKNV